MPSFNDGNPTLPEPDEICLKKIMDEPNQDRCINVVKIAISNLGYEDLHDLLFNSIDVNDTAILRQIMRVFASLDDSKKYDLLEYICRELNKRKI